MKQIGKLAKAMQVLIVSLLVSMALVQGVYGIQLTASGGSNSESGSVAMNFGLAKDATLNTELVINGAAITPTTAISGSISKFEQTHAVKDSTGKSASVSVNVVNAPNGLTYESYVLPGEGVVTVQPWVSAEQWLTVPKADSIKTIESASYGTLSADLGIDVVKGSSLGDYTTLTGYYGKAFASATQVDTIQTATDGSAKSIRIYGHANDGSASFSIDTPITGISGSTASFKVLDALSSAGTSTQVTQKEHIKGGFTSTAKAGSKTITRTSNYGTEYDLNMLAQKVGLSPVATGILGYYVDITNPSANRIQGAVSAAAAGDSINVASGKYLENVQIDKSLFVKGAGKGSTIVDGKKAGSVFSLGKLSPNVDVTLSSMTIQNGAASYGAGIWNRGRTTVTDSTVSGNVANYEGGGIINSGQLTIQGASDISGNTAQSGGGIVNFGTLKLDGSKISGNTASSNGGGIVNDATMTMTGSTLSGNSAANGWGGGIASFGASTTVITSSQITGNHAAQFGGGIVSESTGTITGTIISGNDAKWGGGIYGDGFNTISKSTVSGNIATEYGGGILNDRVMSITDSTITGNMAKTNGGGGIANYGDMVNSAGEVDYSGVGTTYRQADLIVSGTTISNNVATDYGGGVASDGIAEITGCIITGNKAPRGAGVYNAGSMKITGNSISGNIASLFGGGIYNDGTTTINDGSISGNIAKLNGGGIYSYNTLFVGGTTQITNNEATTGRGGGMFAYSGVGTFSGTGILITANKAHLDATEPSVGHSWGVYSYLGGLEAANGFMPNAQITGNVRI